MELKEKTLIIKKNPFSRLQSMLSSIIVGKKENLPKKPDHNSSMAQNEKEMKRLGKEMESMPTNKEVSGNGEIPDPVQYEEK
jgi:hypothetical protein